MFLPKMEESSTFYQKQERFFLICKKSGNLQKPILRRRRYPFGMTCAHLPLTFSVDNDTTFDTLEAVLAIARRGGLRLSRLHVQAAAPADLVSMDLLADDPDLLALFAARLNNVIGVADVDTRPCTLHICAPSLSAELTAACEAPG